MLRYSQSERGTKMKDYKNIGLGLASLGMGIAWAGFWIGLGMVLG